MIDPEAISEASEVYNKETAHLDQIDCVKVDEIGNFPEEWIPSPSFQSEDIIFVNCINAKQCFNAHTKLISRVNLPKNSLSPIRVLSISHSQYNISTRITWALSLLSINLVAWFWFFFAMPLWLSIFHCSI